ncbi:hypothetical protein PPYR_08826 [Photinus pyralis]|uniref:Kinetochore protein SPC25 n=1 Tax=Photinus pyralis TaxID=7054 RepID=A0A1Y1KID2_PHOPY|nr:uncharacterized protein LOC116171850 [Photinus pyralis]XP_031345849.1 uncharacterized protein LOC116172723 [Photinus pyralis]XP_031345850.1 uncharacterized protein LOC116172723 [Photinus pyralis]KAB0797746.1 hypothetical protein PPYR_08739 [Photinus pyralis]KAB0797833.1 hypothetical protein PPYR_08826 [Photinus pyralis]
MSDHFLENVDEIHNHVAVLEHNLNAIQDYKEQFIDAVNDKIGLTSSDLENGRTAAVNVKESSKIDNECQELDEEICGLLNQIQVKEENIRNLTQQLQHKKEALEKLKLEEEAAHINNQTKLKGFQKALHHFTQNFQYTISLEDVEDPNRYHLIMTFIIDKVVSPYPIKFIFENKTDILIDFDGRALLTDDEHRTLSDLYHKRKNTLALLCRLRNITKKRMLQAKSGALGNEGSV